MGLATAVIFVPGLAGHTVNPVPAGPRCNLLGEQPCRGGLDAQQVAGQRTRHDRGDQRLVVGGALVAPLLVERLDRPLVEAALAAVQLVEGEPDHRR